MKNKKQQFGFTLIEIMVVVVIIGLLATLILPNIVGQQEHALQVKAKADIRAISGQLTIYKLDNLSFPSTSEGLDSLVNNPGNLSTWRGYLDRLPKDPWGNAYQYSQPGQRSKNFDLWSYGADGKIGGQDNNKDIGNWEE